MHDFKEGDVVIRTVPFQDNELGQPIKVGDEFTVAAVFDHGTRIAFSLYGSSYKSLYFILKELSNVQD